MKTIKRVLASGLTLALLCGGSVISRAEFQRMAPAACSKVTYLLASDYEGIGQKANGTPVLEASSDGVAPVRQAYNSGGDPHIGHAAWVCPVPDTDSHPASDLAGVYVHVAQRNQWRGINMFLFSKVWFGPGFELKKVGTTRYLCETDPDCSTHVPLDIAPDGNFHSLVVELPPEDANSPQAIKGASELAGLFFY